MSATTAPARIQALVDYALEHGLVVDYDADLRCWEIKTGGQWDRDRIWVYWSGPGANGGRTYINLYRPLAPRRPSRTIQLTYSRARSWIRVLSMSVA